MSSDIYSEFTRAGWKPVSRWALAAGVFAALVFWLHALSAQSGFLILDHVNLPFHEFGHLAFGILGESMGVWGGTLMQLLIPAGIMLYFIVKKETAGVAFSGFWLGENFLNIAAYLADARAMVLPLVGGGEHDWNLILSRLDLLPYDIVISRIVKGAGWVIMIGTIAWFAFTALRTPCEETEDVW